MTERSGSDRRLLGAAPRIAAAAAALAVLALAPGAVSSGATPARTARTVSLSESGRLRLTSHGRNLTLNLQGTASGTIRGTIYIHLHLVSTNHVTAEVNIYPSGGSLTGYAQAGYRVLGPTASFSGSLAIRRGTGTYGRARGSGLRFTGTIQRSNDATSVRLSGSMSY